MCFIVFFFFFQAEDGIRDFHVTGVQTCALPICEQDFGDTAGELFSLLKPIRNVSQGCWGASPSTSGSSKPQGSGLPATAAAVPIPVLSAALYERFSSRGDSDLANRVLSAMRK